MKSLWKSPYAYAVQSAAINTDNFSFHLVTSYFHLLSNNAIIQKIKSVTEVTVFLLITNIR